MLLRKKSHVNKYEKKIVGLVTLLAVTALSTTAKDASADEVIPGNLLITEGSLCVGADCQDGEDFGFDTIRLKSSDPVLQYLDTSSGAFPSNDWSMGVANSGADSAPQFYLKDDSNDTIALRLQAGESGGVALGVNATLQAGTISVGSGGGERRVVFVADGINPTDAATKGQLDAFIDSLGGNASEQLENEREAIDTEIAELEAELSSLVSRLSALETALEN